MKHPHPLQQKLKQSKQIEPVGSIESEYNLELEKIVNEIKKQKAKLVCLQLPDGLKPKAAEIASFIEDKSKAKCLIWLGSCFGSCDIPNVKQLGVDLLVQFGHTPLKAKKLS